MIGNEEITKVEAAPRPSDTDPRMPAIDPVRVIEEACDGFKRLVTEAMKANTDEVHRLRESVRAHEAEHGRRISDLERQVRALQAADKRRREHERQ